jgi:L-ascorbate metabolism protein UlaG (beta-lactamase superfamily)
MLMYTTDIINTSGEDLKIAFLGHGTLMFTFGSTVIHVDPVSDMADYTTLPKADIILVTHEHFDHCDTNAIEMLRKEGTVVVGSESCAEKISNYTAMKNGDVKTIEGLPIEAVPPAPARPRHPLSSPRSGQWLCDYL